MVPRQRAGSGQAIKPDRDLVIDLARFFCLALVVASHTMMVSPVLHADGTLEGAHDPRADGGAAGV